jgi:uncharacterized protein YyaL (SSP411 family)
MAGPSRNNNRLAKETSPYLLQHADNPVDWYPWGEAAFEAARAEGKPILLSVGYAACHWCHVMAHESFEDRATAELMNRLFINIKVDREERPDVDRIYMDALHLMGEQGGWPLTMFLDTERRPFWGGTYFPPTPQYGRPSFTQILERVAEIWTNERDKIASNSQAILEALTRRDDSPTGAGVTPGLLEPLARQLMKAVDWSNGGLGSSQKFPQSPLFELIWTLANELGNNECYRAVALTMTKISQGGIYDHLAGGIARYTVDTRWLVPHFEKMLYDNAQYVRLLAQINSRRPSRLFQTRIDETCNWLSSDMLTSNNLFASSYDADSEGVEGKYYCWQEDEINAILPESTRYLFKTTYDVTPEGNWEHQNILNRLNNESLLDEASEQLLAEARVTLLDQRRTRVPPGWDDKTLTDWNALTASAYVHAYVSTGNQDYLIRANQTLNEIGNHLNDGDQLYHSSRQGTRSSYATADDYAHLITACLDMYQATLAVNWIDRAATYTDQMIQQHIDANSPGFTMASHRTKDLIIRDTYWTDDVTPNANATMITNLRKLSLLTRNTSYLLMAKRIMSAFEPRMTQNAFACPTAWIAWIGISSDPQIILTGDPTGDSFKALHGATLKCAPSYAAIMHVSPNTVLDPSHPAHGKDRGDDPAAFICRNQTCSLPMTDPEALTELLSVH